jgi:predicted nuclease of predicted toxin-antitoxin system
MKILLDSCIAGTVFHQLSQAGYDVIWTGNWLEDPGDETILAYAYQEGRILFTLDKDFGTLAVLRGQPHAGIVRLVSFSSYQQPAVAQQILEQYHTALATGAIITVDPKRIRIRTAGQS